MPDITDNAADKTAEAAEAAQNCISEMEDYGLLPDSSSAAAFSPRYAVYLSICAEQAFCHALLFHISGQIDCAMFQDWQQAREFYKPLISDKGLTEDKAKTGGGFDRWRLVH